MMVELVSISALLLIFLTILLAGGVWIAVALLATGYVGMQFIGGGIPPVRCWHTIWAATIHGRWPRCAIMMGEILFRTKLSEVFRGLAPWLNHRQTDARQRAGLRHLRIGVGLLDTTCATVAKIALPG
jgi:hypothetical protein